MVFGSLYWRVSDPGRIHEDLVFSNRDQRTVLDKMILLVNSLGLDEPFIFAADASYTTGKTARGLIAQGLLQLLAATSPDLVSRSYSSWIRPVRPGLAPPNRSPPSPSEMPSPIFLRMTKPPRN